MSAGSSSERTIAQSVFEGLFIHGLKPDKEFHAELTRAGYDVRNQKSTYPVEVWNQALLIGSRRCFPDLSLPEAERKLGQRFMIGFFSTITGKLIAVTLPIIGAQGLAKRLPRFWSSAGHGVALTTREIEPGHWHIEMTDPTPHPDFDSGVIDAAFDRVKANATVTVTARRANGYSAEVRWKPAR